MSEWFAPWQWGAWRLAWPWALAGIALLIAVAWSAGGALGRPIRLPFADRLPTRPATAAIGFRWPGWGIVLLVGLLALAAARPQWIEAGASRPDSGRDLLLVLDVSASMATADLRTEGRDLTRLAAAARLGGRFLVRRPGDRAGLIVFGSRPYLYVPLSHDLGAVARALESVAVGLAGNTTAIGDAVALAVRTVSGEGAAAPTRSAVVVLISDGAHNAGSLSQEQAAWLAAGKKVRVHALALGAPPPGATADPLRPLTEQTGGRYARATEGAAMVEFFTALDALEPAARPPTDAAVARELYALPLALALLVWFVAGARRLVGAAP